MVMAAWHLVLEPKRDEEGIWQGVSKPGWVRNEFGMECRSTERRALRQGSGSGGDVA